MSVLLILSASVVLLVLQTTLLESVSLAGVKPDLVLAAPKALGGQRFRERLDGLVALRDLGVAEPD